MEFGLETFLTVLHVITDELNQTFVLPRLPNSGGPDPIYNFKMGTSLAPHRLALPSKKHHFPGSPPDLLEDR